jgi:hypothetical protein
MAPKKWGDFMGNIGTTGFEAEGCRFGNRKPETENRKAEWKPRPARRTRVVDGGGRLGWGRGWVRFEVSIDVVRDDELAVHHRPMTGEGAHVIVDAFLSDGADPQRLALARFEHLGGRDDFA